MTEETVTVMNAPERPKFGPDGYTGIALIGTAGSSMTLAPFKDPKWAIWACSPGAYPHCAQNRSDVWFEPHRWLPTPPGQQGAPGTRPWFSAEFHEFLKSHKGPVFMSQVEQTIPSSIRIPFEQLKEKHGPYFWTSTLSYMLAIAIDELAPRAAAGEQVFLGLWGVDMSASEEYAYQRPGCQHFIGLAQSLGINVILPQESDLMRPTTMYGIGEHNPRHIRLLARMREAESLRDQLRQNMAQIQVKLASVEGTIAEQKYMLDMWTDDIETDLRQAVSFAQHHTRPVGELSTLNKDPDSTGAAVLTLEADGRS